jgi:hypothetical protein
MRVPCFCSTEFRDVVLTALFHIGAYSIRSIVRKWATLTDLSWLIAIPQVRYQNNALKWATTAFFSRSSILITGSFKLLIKQIWVCFRRGRDSSKIHRDVYNLIDDYYIVIPECPSADQKEISASRWWEMWKLPVSLTQKVYGDTRTRSSELTLHIRNLHIGSTS